MLIIFVRSSGKSHCCMMQLMISGGAEAKRKEAMEVCRWDMARGGMWSLAVSWWQPGSELRLIKMCIL